MKPSDQYLRDLLWVMNSPSLLRSSLAEIDLAPIPEDHIDQSALSAELSNFSSHRVGRYFEHLILFWLNQAEDVSAIKHSIQIRDTNRTVGEIDFLFEQSSVGLTHLETAIKFYLHYPYDNHTGSHFIGGNANDTFERKMDHLLGDQLALSRSQFSAVAVRHALVRGIIFYHPGEKPPTELPDELAEHHQRGIWLRASELSLLEEFGLQSGYVMDKPHWMATGFNQPIAARELRTELSGHFERSKIAVMLSSESGTRFVVVPSNWPGERPA